MSSLYEQLGGQSAVDAAVDIFYPPLIDQVVAIAVSTRSDVLGL